MKDFFVCIDVRDVPRHVSFNSTVDFGALGNSQLGTTARLKVFLIKDLN